MKTTSISSILVWALLLGFTHTIYAQTDTYHLIVGSYESFDLADQKIGELADLGLDAVTIFPNDSKKRYRVSIFHSKNRREVAAYNKRVQQQGVKDGWIYAEKPLQPIKKPSQASTSTEETTTRDLSPKIEQARKAETIDKDLTYHLIVGSYNDMTSADSYARQLDGEGFEAVILSPDKVSDKFRVSIYFTKNKNEIDAYASSVRRQGKVKGWIYEEHKSDGTRIIPASKVVEAISKRPNMFYLVAASFASHTDAAEHAAKLSKSGMSPSIILPTPGEQARYRISLFQSANRADVVSFQRDLKSKGREAGWILK